MEFIKNISEKIITKSIRKSKSVTAYMTSKEIEGFPNVKAILTPIYKEGLKTIIFTSIIPQDKIEFLKRNNKATVFFGKNSFSPCLIICGTIKFVNTNEIYTSKINVNNTVNSEYSILKLTADYGEYFQFAKLIDVFEI